MTLNKPTVNEDNLQWVISQEALSNPLHLMNSTVKGGLNFINEKIDIAIKNIDLSFNNKVEPLNSRKYDIYQRELAKRSYIDISPLHIPVDPGFIGPYKSYIEILSNSATLINNIEMNVLIPVEKKLLQMLGNPAQMTSITINILNDVKFEDELVAYTKKNIAKYYDSKTNASTQPYSRLVASNSDLLNVMNAMAKLQQRKYNQLDNIVAKSRDIASIANKLISEINEKPQQYMVNNFIAEQLYKLLSKTADEVEFCAALVHHINAAEQGVVNMLEHLNRVIIKGVSDD